MDLQDEQSDSPREQSVPDAPIRVSRKGAQKPLIGVSVPSVKLWFLSSAKREDLAAMIGERSFVIYFFSGLNSRADMVQAEAFREHSLQWAALQYSVLGI